jgi:hypothetical protein
VKLTNCSYENGVIKAEYEVSNEAEAQTAAMSFKTAVYIGMTKPLKPIVDRLINGESERDVCPKGLLVEWMTER